MPGVGRDLVEIASLLIFAAFAALIITRSSQTAEVVSAAGNIFNTSLRIVSGQSGDTFQYAGLTG